MKNYVNMDCKNKGCNGAFNFDCGIDEIIVSARPTEEMLSGFKFYIITSFGEAYVTKELEPTGGLDGGLVEYLIPYGDYEVSGTMQVRLESNEAKGELIDFVIPENLNSGSDVCCKYIGGNFLISVRSDVDPIVDLLLPVGSVVQNESKSFDPNTIYKGTLWERIKGRVLVGVDEADGDFNSVKKAGGAKTHILNMGELPSFSLHTSIKIQHSDGPIVTGEYLTAGLGYGECRARYHAYADWIGENKPHNNLQPYYTVYIWVRRA